DKVIKEFDEATKKLLDSDLRPVAENSETQYKASELINDFKNQVQKIQSAIFTVKYNADVIPEAVDEMSLQKDIFVQSNKQFYLDFNSGLAEEVRGEVNKKLALKQTLTDVCNLIADTQNETDIHKIKANIDSVSAKISSLDSKSDRRAFTWAVSSDYMKMLISFMLVLDGIIIISYWIGEVFKDRDKCREINYERLKNSMR
ncbi:MAG: hypothetical protein K2K60_02385, partial [Clostridia bacterium]|nr:hypothetical protein [Clostridia bacterium]